MPARIDLDANATTPVLPEVYAAMQPWLTERWGNPSSAHLGGQRSRAAVERARAQVAALLNAQPSQIVFTSGGTESNNHALFGVMEPLLRNAIAHGTATPHMITMATEHHAVLYPGEELQRRGAAVTFLAPQTSGLVDVDQFRRALTPQTRLVSIMLANNETGVIQPVGKLARIVREYAAEQGTAIAFHTDAVQAAGKLPVDLAGEFRNVDLLSLSGHKIYAPGGTGVLFIRSGLTLGPLLHGGPHERQRRAGTENVPGVVALGQAAQLSQQWLAGQGPATLAGLTHTLERGLLDSVAGAQVNAGAAPRVPNTTNICFAGVEAEPLLIALDLQGISVSYGAACMSGATEPSHVLTAMGLTSEQARSSVRFSLSRLTTAAQIARALEIIPAAVDRLRAAQPA